MSDMICRKSMMRCQTPGMCSPHGGCRDEVTTAKDRQISALIAENERLRADYAALATFNPDWDRVAAAQDSVREHMELANRLKAECEGLRKDAERYRWLRRAGNTKAIALVAEHCLDALDEAIVASVLGETVSVPKDLML